MKLKAKILVPILAVSLSQIARAVAFNSIVVSGNWSAPASWDVGGVAPDTYAGASVTINNGHSIDYDDIGGGVGSMSTPAGLVGVGGFAIAGGNSVTIDGGILTQTTLQQEMRVGEGTSGAGTAFLTIQTGGLLDTGASIGLVVGTKISGAVAGDGEVDIKEGTLKLGAGAAAGGLGVGVDSSTGVLNVGDGAGPAGSAIVDLLTNNVQMGVGANPGALGGGTGTVNIKSDGVLNYGTSNMNIGQGGGTGTLTIDAGGSMSGGSGSIYLGDGAGSNGTFTNNGTVTLTGELQVGRNGGTGTYTQTGGSLNLNGHHIQIAEGGGSTGTINITAGALTGSSWIHVGSGAGATGNLNVNFTNPADVLTTGDLYVGNNGATGNVTVSNGSLRSTGVTEVGRGGGGTGILTITGANSSVEAFTGGAVDQFFRVGMTGGNGTVDVSGGGKINTHAGWFTLGENNGSVGAATFSGAGTTLTSTGIIVGWNGLATGTLNIVNNAVVNNSGHEVSIGRDAGGVNSPTGTVNIASGGILNAGNELRIGGNATGVVNINGGTLNTSGGNWTIIGEGGAASGTVNMTNGVFNDHSNMVSIAQNPGSIGVFNQSGAGSTTTIAGELNIARDRGFGDLNISGGTFSVGGWTVIGRDNNGNAGGMGTINVSNGATFQHTASGGGDLLLGWKGGSTGKVNVTTGGKIIYNWWVRAAVDPGSQGDILIDGAGSRFDQNTGRTYIGERGTGTLTVTNGGVFSQTNGDQFNVGGNDTSSTGDGTGTINVAGAGSTVSTNNFIRVGFGNTGADPAVGVMNIASGGTVSSGGWIGFGHEGGDGTLNMTGGTLTTVNELYIGIDDNGHSRQTTGQATVSGGAALNIGSLYIGRNGGLGTFTLNSGTITVHREAKIGNGGVGGGGGVSTGTLSINGATSSVAAFTDGGNDFFRVGVAGGNGTVNVTGGGTLTTNAGWFTLGENNGSVGTATVTGAGSTLTANGIIVGWNGLTTGTLNIANNGVVNNVGHELSIGRDNGGANSPTGIINITSGGTLNTVEARIGHNTTGTVNITNGNLHSTAGWAYVGTESTSHGTVNMSGASTATFSDQLLVGHNGGQGVYNQSGGTTTVSAEFNLGRTGGTGTLNLTGGTFNVNGWTTMGKDGGSGTGTINVSGSGVFNHTPSGSGDLLLGWTNGSHGAVNVTAGGTVNYNWWVRTAVDPGSNGSILVDGAGSTFNVGAGRVYIGEKSAGTLTISNGGAFTHLGGDDFTVGGRAGEEGPIAGANGILTVSGASSSLTNPGGFLRVGRGSVGAAPSVGTVNLSAGSINAGNWIGFGHEGGDGHLNMSGGSITAANEFYVGVDNNGSSRQTTGIAVMTGGTINSGTLIIGRNGADGRFTNSGGTINTGGINVGHGSAGSVGRFTQFSGTTTGTGALDVGNGNGQGTVIVNGGTVSSNGFYVGTNPGGNGLVNVNNGTLNIEGWTEIGRLGGTAVVNVDGPTALLDGTSQDMMIGKGAGSIGTVNILNGGQMSQNWWIVLGRDGGPTATGVINVDGSGSKLTHTSGRFILGGDPNDGAQSGTGIVNISHGGWIEETGGNNREIDLGRGVGSTGTMNISTSGKFTDTTDATVFLGVNGSAGYLNITGAGSLFSHTPNIGDFTASPIVVGWDSTSTGEVHVDNGGTLTSSQEIRVGANGAANGVFGVNGGTVTAGVFSLGRNGGNGTMNMQAGSVTTNAWMTVGHDGGHGVLNLTGGAITTNTDHFYVAIGGGGTTGVVNHTGGSVVSHRDVRIGQESTASGTYNLSGAGSSVTADNELYVGLNNGTGILNQSNGTVTAANVRIGTNGSSSGTVVKSGGTLTAVGDLTVGWQNNAVGNLAVTGGAINVGVDAYVGVRDSATGNFVMSAGTMTIGRNFIVAADAGTTGNVQLDGGTIQAASFLYSGGTASVNFNGGTVKAKQNQGDFFSGYTPAMSEVQAGGLKFDSNGFTATANNSFDGAGGLTKNGNGTLALTAANTYGGGTVINTGTLNVNANAALGNVAGGVAINNNAILQAAAPVTTSRTITLGAGGGKIDTNGNTVTLGVGSTVTGGAGIALTHIGNGTLDIKGTQTYAILNANGGVTTLDSALGGGTSTLNANATVQINVSQTLGALNIADGVEVTFGDGLPFAPEPPKPLASFGGVGLVPEPGSLGLLLVGALGFIARRRRGAQSR